jgi:hypothetical protein
MVPLTSPSRVSIDPIFEEHKLHFDSILQVLINFLLLQEQNIRGKHFISAQMYKMELDL